MELTSVGYEGVNWYNLWISFG